MEIAEKMPLPGSPKGIAEAMELPDNHFYFKASTNVLSSRKVESDVPIHIEESVTAHVKESMTTHVANPISVHIVEPISAHVEDSDKVTSFRSSYRMDAKKAAIDTTSPFESVKEAVSRFGGSIDWKAHRAQTIQQRPKSVGIELETSKEIVELRRQAETNGDKFELPMDLYNTKKLIEELKQNLEKAQKEEHEATQALEVAILKVEELKQEITNESKHTSTLLDLNSTKEDLKALHKQYASMAIQRDIAIKMAKEAVVASKKVEKSMTCLAIELEALEIAKITHHGAIYKGCYKWKLELQHVDEKLQRLNGHVLVMKNLKSKLDASFSLLLNLKFELASYMESKLKQEGDEDQIKVLEEVKINIEKAIVKLSSILVTIRQSEEKAFVVFASLKAKLDNIRSQIALIEMKEKEVKDKMVELPKKLEQAEQEANQAKSLAHVAQIELCEAKEKVKQAKAKSSTMETRLLAAQAELEDVKSSEMLAIEAIKVLQEYESNRNNNDMDFGVTLGLEEYYELRKQAHKAEKQANLKVAATISQIEIAKDSELNSLNELEKMNQELAVRRESLKMATERAEKAQEGKLSVEQMLRNWKADHEQQRNGSFEEKKEHNHSEQTIVPSNDTIIESTLKTVTPETKTKKKKKQLFPRVVMFFAKRKARHNK